MPRDGPKDRGDKRKPIVFTNINDVAHFFGLTRAAVLKWFQDGCPGKSGSYDLFEIVDWWATNRRLRTAIAEEKRNFADNEGQLKTEKLKLEVEEKKVKLAEKLGDLMPVEHLRTILSGNAQHYRKAGEQLQRAYGDDAQAIVHDALDDAERELQTVFNDQSAQVES